MKDSSLKRVQNKKKKFKNFGDLKGGTYRRLDKPIKNYKKGKKMKMDQGETKNDKTDKNYENLQTDQNKKS